MERESWLVEPQVYIALWSGNCLKTDSKDVNNIASTFKINGSELAGKIVTIVLVVVTKSPTK